MISKNNNLRQDDVMYSKEGDHGPILIFMLIRIWHPVLKSLYLVLLVHLYKYKCWTNHLNITFTVYLLYIITRSFDDFV